MKDDDKLSVDEAIALIEQHMDPANLESGNVTTNEFGVIVTGKQIGRAHV